MRGAIKLKRLLNYFSSLTILNLSKAILPISKHIEREIIKHGIINKRIYILGIPTTTLIKNIDTNSSVNFKKPFVITVTNFNFYKKVRILEDLISHTSEILKKHDVDWLILGNGLFLKNVKSSCAHLKNVHFSHTNETYTYYRDSLFVIYFSGIDGLPNVLLESAAHKKLFVINSSSPAVEFIDNMVTGFIIDDESVKDLESKLHEILKNPEQFKNISDSFHDKMSSSFSVENLSIKLLDVIKAEKII